ncbi:hypothetical protein C9374_002384 [Naegleria lovaniensis]|uniref:B30.2/SPRY domain-containing protein n=1 Tax=Naegleria lovaniensis TaxID=51637 RepID=A0AA88GTK1_NAELO|nr:uncharacterized protein C9374_002384 [Naegleria lovaniensis]KAG2386640.1 hypothetical protein C9374_002384 [Naegleria lovaniensis]
MEKGKTSDSSSSTQPHVDRDEIQFGLDHLAGTLYTKLDKEQNTFLIQVKEAATGRTWKRVIGSEDALEISKQGTKLSVEAIAQMVMSAFKGEEKNLSLELLFCTECYPLSTPSSEMKNLTPTLNEIQSEKCALVVEISLKAVFLTVKVAFTLEEVERSEQVMIEDLMRKNFYFSQMIERLELKNTLLEHKYLLQSKQISDLENRLTELTQLFIQTLQLQKLRNMETLLEQQPSQEAYEETVEEVDQFSEACNPNCVISEDKKRVHAKENAWGTTCRLSNHVSVHNNYVEFVIEKFMEECVLFFGIITSEYDKQLCTENNVIGSSQYSNSFALSLTDKKFYCNGRSVSEAFVQEPTEWKVGDKIGMLVDFKQASLNYFLNGKLIAQTFKGQVDENKRWYFCVSLCKAGDCVSIAPKDE